MSLQLALKKAQNKNKRQTTQTVAGGKENKVLNGSDKLLMIANFMPLDLHTMTDVNGKKVASYFRSKTSCWLSDRKIRLKKSR